MSEFEESPGDEVHTVGAVVVDDVVAGSDAVEAVEAADAAVEDVVADDVVTDDAATDDDAAEQVEDATSGAETSELSLIHI